MRGAFLFFFPRPPPSITSSFDARRYTAATLRLSLRATTVVFVFSRASAFSIRTSSFVHGRLLVATGPVHWPSLSCSSIVIWRIAGEDNLRGLIVCLDGASLRRATFTAFE